MQEMKALKMKLRYRYGMPKVHKESIIMWVNMQNPISKFYYAHRGKTYIFWISPFRIRHNHLNLCMHFNLHAPIQCTSIPTELTTL